MRDLNIGRRVQTKDGQGTIVGEQFLKNTNNGPGCKCYVVRLN